MKKLFIATLFVGTTMMPQAQFMENDANVVAQKDIVPPYVISNVAAVREMADNTYVSIQGNIVQRQGHDQEKYLFKDASGDIIVEIEDHVWRHQTVTPGTTVKILGELDQSSDPHRVEIEAVYLEVIQ